MEVIILRQESLTILGSLILLRMLKAMDNLSNSKLSRFFKKDVSLCMCMYNIKQSIPCSISKALKSFDVS